METQFVAEQWSVWSLVLMAIAMGRALVEVFLHVVLWFEDIEREMEGERLEEAPRTRVLCPGWTFAWYD
jgi:hypothetical protein